MKKQYTTYSVRTYYQHGPRVHSLAFYWNPIDQPNAYTDNTKLSHAKKTLDHCRKKWSGFRHEIIKTTTITEIMKY